MLSIALRSPIFLVATIRRGAEATIAALVTEAVFCISTAGIYGAIVQVLRRAEPQWLTGFFVIAVVPAIFQVLEYLLHWSRGTPHLRVAEIALLTLSTISALFNWYAMRRGTLLVGAEGHSLAADLQQLPRLVIAFLAILPSRLARRFKDNSSKLSN